MSFAHSVFCGFSVHDLKEARAFYTENLGLKLLGEEMGLMFELPGGGRLFLYEKADHQPATFTVLNFVVDDIDVTVDDFRERGMQFERYDTLGPGIEQDEKGILRGRGAKMGPDIAWLRDPSANILAILQE